MRRALALPLALALLAPVGAAFHRADAPLASGALAGPGWISLALLSAEGGTVSVELEGTTAGTTGAGVAVYHAGALVFVGALVLLSETSGVRLEARPAPGVGLAYDAAATSRPLGGFGLALDLRDLAPDDYVVAAWAAGPVGGWSWAARGDATAGEQRNGDGAWVATAEDFRAAVDAGASTHGADVRALAGGAYPLRAENSLVGVYVPVAAVDGLVLRAQGPEGEAICACAFLGEPAGDYRLTLDGAGASGRVVDAAFTAADVALPE